MEGSAVGLDPRDFVEIEDRALALPSAEIRRAVGGEKRLPAAVRFGWVHPVFLTDHRSMGVRPIQHGIRSERERKKEAGEQQPRVHADDYRGETGRSCEFRVL
jgi:hypothetical protein